MRERSSECRGLRRRRSRYRFLSLSFAFSIFLFDKRKFAGIEFDRTDGDGEEQLGRACRQIGE